jgi:hypothetical protein
MGRLRTGLGSMSLFAGDSIQDVLIELGQSPVIIEPPQ